MRKFEGFHSIAVPYDLSSSKRFALPLAQGLIQLLYVGKPLGVPRCKEKDDIKMYKGRRCVGLDCNGWLRKGKSAVVISCEKSDAL